MAKHDTRPLVMHVVYRFDVGGLENGIVNIINRLPVSEFRHSVVALTHCSERFSRRITRDDVSYVSLEKPPGQGWRVYRRIWGLFREARPAIVHSRNIAALEMQLPAACAGVPVRVHGEHGWDVTDPRGDSRKYRLVRRAFSPFVTHYVALSRQLRQYLTESVGIAEDRVVCIPNGVDEQKFAPVAGHSRPAEGVTGRVVVGTVGRLGAIKGHCGFVDAVGELVGEGGIPRHLVRVRIVGDGPSRSDVERRIASLGLDDVFELPGESNDVSEVMRELDIFVLPSLAEGISNTVLEAMASGLPVIATDVGGNRELIDEGRTGEVVPPDNPHALAEAMARYIRSPTLRQSHGEQGRMRIEREFGLTRMIEAYRSLYERALAERAPSETQIT